MTTPSPSPDALLHLATLHILSSAGFPSTSRAASVTLSSIAAKYLRTIAQSCTEQAALAGRSKVGAGDVMGVLEEMGQGAENLERWFADGEAGRKGVFDADLEELREQMREGMELPDALAELKIVPNADIIEEEESDEETMTEEDGMDVDPDGPTRNIKSERLEYFIRSSSPDFSWLPPLPGQSAAPDLHIPKSELPSTSAPTPNIPTQPLTKLSLIDKYRIRQPFSTSSLSQSNFIDPPPHPSPNPVPAPTSSFPALLATYKAIAGEPSVSLAQTPLRQQAADLIRRVIAPPDMYGVSDSLSGPIPSPTGRIITASASDTLPPPTLPVNTNPTGTLARLVREMRSPHLPPTLRDRLTTLRPPLPLHDDEGKPIFYGDPVRGPDAGTLNKARGRPGGSGENGEEEKNQEAYYRYTWDAGPRGIEKWGKGKLPSGKKVIQSGQGEESPRTSDKKPAGVAIKLRLDRSPLPTPGAGVSPDGDTVMDWEKSEQPAGYSEGRENKQGSISLRIPNQAGLSSLSNPSPTSQNLPTPKLKFSTASLSPNPITSVPDSSAPNSLAPPEPRIPRIKLSPNPITGNGPATTSALSPSIMPSGPISPAPVSNSSGTAPKSGGGGFKIRLGVKKDPQ